MTMKKFIAIITIALITSIFSTAMAAKTPVGTIQYPTTRSGGIIATRFTQEGELAPKEKIPEWARRSIEPYKGSWSEAPGRLDKAARAWPYGAEKGMSTFSLYGWSVDPSAAVGGLGWPDGNNNGIIDSIEEVQALLWATVWPTEPYGLQSGLTVARTSDQGYGSVYVQFKNVTLELRKVRRTFHFNVTNSIAVTTPVNGWCWGWAWAQPGTGSGKNNSGNSNGGNSGSNQPTVKPTQTATTTTTPAPNQTQNPTATPAPTNQTQAPTATATPDPQLDAVPSSQFENQMFDSSTPIVAPRTEQQGNAPTATPTPAPATSSDTGDHITLDVVVEPQGWTSNFESTQVASAPSSEGGRHRGSDDAASNTGSGFSISTSSEGAGEGQPDPGLDNCGPDPWD